MSFDDEAVRARVRELLAHRSHLVIYEGIGGSIAITADLDLVELDEDGVVLGAPARSLALVALKHGAAKYYPFLAALLPQRTTSSVSCAQCNGKGELYGGFDCGACSGLGWTDGDAA